MIRNLLIVSAAGFVLALACGAGAIGLAHKDLKANNFTWTFEEDQRDGLTVTKGSKGQPEAQIKRELTWDGTDMLQVDLPYKVTYVTGDVASVKVEGPKSLVERLILKDGKISLADGERFRNRVVFNWTAGHFSARSEDEDFHVTVTAPNVKRFALLGSGDLEVRNYAQETLDLSIQGSGHAEVIGRAKSAKLDITGSGHADFESLINETTEVSIAGSGEAEIAPTEAAKVTISGSGSVELSSKPKTVTTSITGTGELIRQDVHIETEE